MKLKLTFRKLAEITKATLISVNPDADFNSFVTNSGKVKKNSVFWCLKGENYDAHTFLPQVIEKGAKAIIVKQNTVEKLKQKPPHILEVSDTLKALHDLSLYHKNKFKIKTIAVTGSNGKTTVKEMLRHILQSKVKTFANKGNLNNQFGLPFSLLELNRHYKYAVLELAAKKRGDIYEIASLVGPDTAVITNIAPAHLEFFGSIENIYRTKTEIIKCLKPGGTLVYNGDDLLLKRIAKNRKIKTLTFGFGNSNDVRISNSKDFILIHKGKKYKISLKLNTHNKLNAAAASAALIASGLDWQTIMKGFSHFKSPPMRLQVMRKNKSVIIFDCYNSNPVSAENALKELVLFKSKKPKIAVLGDMKELGKFSKKYHSELGRQAARIKVDAVFMAGTEMIDAYRQAKKMMAVDKLAYGRKSAVWIDKLKAAHKKGAVILFKASRDMKFENLLKKL